MAEYVSDVGGVVRPSPRGLELGTRPPDELEPASFPSHAKLSAPQEEFLRELLRQHGPVLEERADGRVLRALQAQGLVVVTAGWISATDRAAAHLVSHSRRSEVVRRRRASRSPQSARAEAVLRAVEQLEAAVPRGAELLLGEQPAYADDVFRGLRRLAREMGDAER